MPAGHLSEFKQDYIRQARIVAFLNATDEQIADLFNVSIETIAIWAWENEEFYNAITPTNEDRERYKKERFDSRAKIRERRKRNLQKNASERINNSMRSRIYAAIKGKGYKKGLLSNISYTVVDLMTHLEKRFQPGMNWENYGKWHIDHIRPCASFDLDKQEEFDECWKLENLQPLWAYDNISKGSKYASS